jgi:peptidoglycan/xylan/chitin deacetylase (PgdA/CDA1 family)
MTPQADNPPAAPDRSPSAGSAGKALVLLYHRVTELPTDPQLLCVAPSRFGEHLEILRRHNVMSLRQMVRAMDGGAIPPRSVVVTFDDGYADNLHNAKPLLEQFHVPATVFVVSGSVGSSSEFWWDDLDRLLLQPGTLPETLHLTIAGVPHEWRLGDSARYDAAAYERFRAWNVLGKADPTPRHAIYRELCNLLRPLSSEERRQAVDQLSRWASTEAGGRWTHRMLSPEELRQLPAGGLIEVGAHTVTHPVLSACPAAGPPEQPPSTGGGTASAEIRDSKAQLENIVGRPVTSFSYPYGSRADYTAETVDLVRGAGFACACSNFFGPVRPDTDRYQLPRVIVRDWDGDEFARRLEHWWSNV